MQAPTNQVVVVQTILRAAVKTFIQAGIVFIAPPLLAWINGTQLALTNAASGGSIDIDLKPLAAIGIGAVLAGVAALISAAWNWTKGPTTTKPVTAQPPAKVNP